MKSPHTAFWNKKKQSKDTPSKIKYFFFLSGHVGVDIIMCRNESTGWVSHSFPLINHI